MADDDENFELVDYTAASGWEKFVASIEARLRAWQVGDGRRGDFDFAELQRKCSGLVARRRQDRAEVRAQISALCTRTCRLAHRGAAYTLTLSVHPALHAGAAPDPLAAQFLPSRVPELEIDHSQAEPEHAWHPLHRWTGCAALIYLQYVGDARRWDDAAPDSDDGQDGPGDNYSVSLETAKLLASSMNIAMQNARCQLPAFVPVGDAWRRLFTGRAAGSAPEHPGHVAGIVQRFDTVCLGQAPAAYLQLGGLLGLFASALRVPDSSGVQVAALHTYRAKNTYARAWNAASPDFYYRMGDLNVGPVNDPLRTIALDALFQQAPCRTYLDPQSPGRDRLYLKTASAWVLSAQMIPAEKERTMLTEVLEDAFASWAQSTSGANRHRHLSLAEQMEAHAEITSGMLVELFGPAAGSHISLPGLDPAAKDTEALRASEARLDQTLAEVYADGSASRDRPHSVAQLTARMPHGAAVPYGSLLWRLSEIVLVATAKRSADLWGAPSIMTFLRLLWAMALKEIRWRWENAQLVPRIPTAADHAVERGAAASASGSQTPAPPSVDSAPGSQTRFNVHLRYALAHQKLEMINCCVERKLVRDAAGPGPATSALDALLDPAAARQSAGEDGSGSRLAQRMRTHVNAQLRQEKAPGSDGGRGSRSSRIRRPIGRLLTSMRSVASEPPRRPEPLAAAAADIGEFEEIGPCESESEGFVSAEDDYADDDDDDNDDCSSSALLLLDQSSLDDTKSLPAPLVPERLPPNAVAVPASADGDRQAAPLEVSPGRDANYIDVAIASSMDSTSGFHHVSGVYERSPQADTRSGSDNPTSEELPAGEAGQEPGELGPDESAGGLHESPTLRLLETGAPMWIPKIQMQPVLTDDMLRERETILMSFGTSTEGARQRARLQCAELISDMESFKAANPRCSLADFVRWHSPRDWVVPEGAAEMEGRLSVRMASGGADGNLWQKLWAEARRVPADRQRLLFDHEVEAEKALHHLEGTPVYALFASLLPTMFLIAYERLYRQPIVHRIGLLRTRLAALGTRIAQHVDWAASDPDSPVYSSLMDDLEALEVQTSRCVSLLCKFPDQYALAEAVVQHGQAPVATRDAQKVVLRALARLGIPSAPPARREYVFSAQLRRPEAPELAVPQRMYAAVEGERSLRVVYGRGQ
ncbi:hypothetical protein H4R18_000685 [Coemansia javaensis]|uniref:Rab3 GTPase-activating protein catalytic subunit n=1 Tax=Coemansia javaensis TaxID=2761396 RepID=A0A9W8HG63_9FUNG|nr:hypothetical protein H4R18_000685 [Coemansia javaensis]